MNIVSPGMQYYVFGGYLPPKTGGQVYLNKLFEALKNQKYSVEYLPIEIFISQSRVNAGKYFRRLAWIPWIGDLLTACFLAKELLPLKGIFIQDHYYADLLIVFNLLTWFLGQGKAIITVFHFEKYRSNQQTTWEARLTSWKESLSLAPASTLVTISEFTKREILSLGIPEQKIVVISPGFESLAVQKNFLRPHTESVELLCVSHCIPRKGIHILIQAIAELRSIPLHVNIVGSTTLDPQYFSSIVQLVEVESLQAKVSFVGRASDEDLHNFYLKADIFVLPTLMEGFGIALVEAMSYSLPVIASSVGALPELVNHGVNGLLFPPEDSKALAAAIAQLVLSQETRLLMGEAGNKKSKLFSWEKCTEKFLTLLKANCL